MATMVLIGGSSDGKRVEVPEGHIENARPIRVCIPVQLQEKRWEVDDEGPAVLAEYKVEIYIQSEICMPIGAQPVIFYRLSSMSVEESMRRLLERYPVPTPERM